LILTREKEGVRGEKTFITYGRGIFRWTFHVSKGRVHSRKEGGFRELPNSPFLGLYSARKTGRVRFKPGVGGRKKE